MAVLSSEVAIRRRSGVRQGKTNPRLTYGGLQHRPARQLSRTIIENHQMNVCGGTGLHCAARVSQCVLLHVDSEPKLPSVPPFFLVWWCGSMASTVMKGRGHGHRANTIRKCRLTAWTRVVQAGQRNCSAWAGVLLFGS